MLKALPPEILVTNPKSQLIEILTPPLFFVKIGTRGGGQNLGTLLIVKKFFVFFQIEVW